MIILCLKMIAFCIFYPHWILNLLHIYIYLFIQSSTVSIILNNFLNHFHSPSLPTSSIVSFAPSLNRIHRLLLLFHPLSTTDRAPRSFLPFRRGLKSLFRLKNRFSCGQEYDYSLDRSGSNRLFAVVSLVSAFVYRGRVMGNLCRSDGDLHRYWASEGGSALPIDCLGV